MIMIRLFYTKEEEEDTFIFMINILWCDVGCGLLLEYVLKLHFHISFL
jgi:hypothetical protein